MKKKNVFKNVQRLVGYTVDCRCSQRCNFSVVIVELFRCYSGAILLLCSGAAGAILEQQRSYSGSIELNSSAKLFCYCFM